MKDARGHGSNSRGGSVPDQHQHRILRDTVANPLKGIFLGGPNAAEAESTLRSKFGYGDAQIAALKGDHPKSAPVEAHPSMAGGASVVPRDVAARFAAQRDAKNREDRGFRSGQREINRLKRQGK